MIGTLAFKLVHMIVFIQTTSNAINSRQYYLLTKPETDVEDEGLPPNLVRGSIATVHYFQETVVHANPLVHNKGSAKRDKGVPKPSVSSPHVPGLQPETKKPARLASAEQGTPKPPPDPQAKFGLLVTTDLVREQSLVKKPTNKSVESDCALVLTSECDLSEGFSNAGLLLIPLFETPNTMANLLQPRQDPLSLPQPTPLHPDSLEQPAGVQKPEESPESLAPLKLFKSRSALPGKRNSIEHLSEDMTEEELAYLTKLYAFKNNYLHHVLQDPNVFKQYVTLSKADLTFTTTASFQAELRGLLTQQGKYMRDERLYQGKKTLVLDLDETLAYASPDPMPGSETRFTYLELMDGPYTAGQLHALTLHVKLRPHLREFLDDMSHRYELIVYTAAEDSYANQVLDFVEQDCKYFAHRLYHPQCLHMQNRYLFKPLELLCANRTIKDIIIIDNNVGNYALSIRNGIPINSFCGNPDDNELIYLAKYLRVLAKEEDVRTTIKDDFVAYFGKHYPLS